MRQRHLMPFINQHQRQYNTQGFTLIEIMLVLVLIGMMVSFVQFSFQDNKLERDLEKAGQQFVAAFTLASEYSLLNNVELGIVFDEEQYQFVGFDGEKWHAVEEHEFLKSYSVPQQLTLTLTLDGLEIDEQALFDIETFQTEDEGLFNNTDFKGDGEEKKIIPQIFILSGGEITPFRLTLTPSEDLDDDSGIAFQITGDYSMPLNVSGVITL